MPNRIIKESICTSDTINELSPEPEILFYRLMVQCDDYGRFDARVPILRARCFPLRLDTVSEADVSKWLDELEHVGLLWRYSVDERCYLQLTKWAKHQNIRAQRSKFPDPLAADSDGLPTQADASNSMQSPPYSNSKSESESISKVENGTKVELPPPKPRKRRSRADPRTKHPAIQAVRAVTGRLPSKAIYNRIIELLGDEPDIEKMTRCFEEWVIRGFKVTNFAWLFEWFVSGISARRNRASSTEGNHIVDEWVAKDGQ